VIGTATFDARKVYRYRLTRTWDVARPSVVWVMLNPSTATASTDDATIRRVVDFSRRWAFGSAEIVNLFALRSTKPDALLRARDPVGPENDDSIADTRASADAIVVAWGSLGAIANPGTGVARCEEVVSLVGESAMCLGVTKEGQPRHPLYLPAVTSPIALSGVRVT
jgi:hypothetical protein